jgi:hypothetical protein
MSRSYGTYRGQPLVVFNQQSWEGLPAFSKLMLKPVKGGWELQGTTWSFFSRVIRVSNKGSRLRLREGLIVNSISIEGDQAGQFTFSRRFRDQSNELCEALMLSKSTEASTPRVQSLDKPFEAVVF